MRESVPPPTAPMETHYGGKDVGPFHFSRFFSSMDHATLLSLNPKNPCPSRPEIMRSHAIGLIMMPDINVFLHTHPGWWVWVPVALLSHMFMLRKGFDFRVMGSIVISEYTVAFLILEVVTVI